MISDLILSLVLIVLSSVWAGIGIFKLGLWKPGVSADSGFIPTVFSVVTLICAVIMLVQTLRKMKSVRAEAADAGTDSTVPSGADAGVKTAGISRDAVLGFIRKYSIVLFGVFGAIALKILGLIPMSLLVIFGWMKLINRASWLKSIVVAVLATVAIYLIFGMWLRIPFPGLI